MSPRIELYTRDGVASVPDRFASVYDRVVELEELGAVDDISVQHWSTPVGSERIVRPGREQYESLLEWARRQGHDLEPAFTVRRAGSMVSGTTERVLIPPLISVAIYHEDELIAVAPCSAFTVEECLDQLETGSIPGMSTPHTSEGGSPPSRAI